MEASVTHHLAGFCRGCLPACGREVSSESKGQGSEDSAWGFSHAKSGFQEPASWKWWELAVPQEGGNPDGVCREAVAFSKESPLLFHDGDALFPKTDALVIMISFLSLSWRGQPGRGQSEAGLGKEVGVYEKSPGSPCGNSLRLCPKGTPFDPGTANRL